jgi:hypothetical protein
MAVVGTFRTSRAVWQGSAMSLRADVNQRRARPPNSARHASLNDIGASYAHRLHGCDNAGHPRGPKMPQITPALAPDLFSTMLGLWTLRLFVSRWRHVRLRPRRRWLSGSSSRPTKASGTRTSSWRSRWPKAWCPRCSADCSERSRSLRGLGSVDSRGGHGYVEYPRVEALEPPRLSHVH